MSYKVSLLEWGLQDYVEKFEDEGIDDESFLLMDNETINTVFTKSGPRLIFKKRFEELKMANNQQFTLISEVESTASTDSLNTVSTVSLPESDYSFEPDEDILSAIGSSVDKVEDFPMPQSPKRKLFEEITDSKRAKQGDVFPEGLEVVLKKYTDGQIALLNKDKLTNDCRQKIVKVIINEVVASFGPEIRASTFLQVAEDITKIFPNEKIATYYMPYIPGGKNRKGVGPKGKLWSRYVNVRTALRQANNLRKLEVNRESKENTPPSESQTALLEFLKSAIEPFTKILDAWEQTYKLRKKLYLNADLSQVFKDFPCLQLNSGIELIETDFNKRHSNHIDIIYTTWPKISEAIMQEAKERNINVLSCQDSTLQALMTLPYLFSPITLKKGRKGANWRPTRSEVQESFFLHINNFEDLNERLSLRRKKLDDFGLTLQPMACVVGPLEKAVSFYILVDNATYKLDSCIRVLELLFKLFHALDIEYPVECEHIWLFLEYLVFKIKPSKKCPATEALMTDIQYHLREV